VRETGALREADAMPTWLAALVAPIAMILLAYAVAALVVITRWLHRSIRVRR
jgi:hypothetical protein